jgi:hypothetical protein
VLDSGASGIYLPRQAFDTAVQNFDGLTAVESNGNGDEVFFECAKPQLLEPQMHGQWLPVDSLDIFVPNSQHEVNGTELRDHHLYIWQRDREHY